jgi:hypothetical protein
MMATIMIIVGVAIVVGFIIAFTVSAIQFKKKMDAWNSIPLGDGQTRLDISQTDFRTLMREGIVKLTDGRVIALDKKSGEILEMQKQNGPGVSGSPQWGEYSEVRPSGAEQNDN